MVDTLKGAAAAAGRKAFFGDELVLLDFNAAAAAAVELQPQALLLQDFFDPSVDSLPGLPVESGGGGGYEEEEELEWLANKDAFPSLETSFEIPAHSLSGSSSGWSGGGGAVSAREGPSPASVLASAASFSAPARPRSKGRAQRRRLLTAISPQPVAAAATARKARAAERRRCRHCLAEKTPQWRMGPEGPKTLCNACGVRYKSGRLVPEYRPASSPSFSTSIHSNSHRQILEMRRQKDAPRERKSTRPQPPPPQQPLVTLPVKLIPKKTKKIKK